MTVQEQDRYVGQNGEDEYIDPTFAALLQKDMVRVTEYTPFGAKEKISLTPERVIRYLCRPTKSGATCTVEQATRFIMLCKARELNPWEGDAFIVGYDTKDGPEFNLVTAHQAFLKRAEAHHAYEGMEGGVVVSFGETEEVKDIEGDFIPADCKLVGGWARVYRNDRKIQTYRRLSLSAFSKPFGVWNVNAAGMIVKCAEADALRSAFPNNLAGMYMKDEFSTEQVSDAPTPAEEPAGTRTETTRKSLKAPTAAKRDPIITTAEAPRETAAEKILNHEPTTPASPTPQPATVPTTAQAPTETNGPAADTSAKPPQRRRPGPAQTQQAEPAAEPKPAKADDQPSPTDAPPADERARILAEEFVADLDAGGMMRYLENIPADIKTEAKRIANVQTLKTPQQHAAVAIAAHVLMSKK